MLTRLTAVSIISITSLLSINAQANTTLNEEFTVSLGPLKLGDVVMASDCDINFCSYETRIKGSFMFISAKINETGTYKKKDEQVTPINTLYTEKIGSKKKTFIYDFTTKKITDKRKNRELALPEHAYPFIPLLNQVALDLASGGPREHYEYLSQHKIKRASISAYTQKMTENGTVHHFVGKGKENELEFFFLENEHGIQLDKIAFGSFHMSKKRDK